MMTRTRWMALLFALGSTCFLIGPFPGYANLVGDAADSVTFFVGSVLFTAGGALQTWLSWPGRGSPARDARPGGAPVSNPPARCSSTPRHFRPCTRRSRAPSTTSSSGGRMLSARSASWSRAGSRTEPRPARAGSPPARAWGGGSRASTCSDASSRHLRRRGIRSVEGLDAGPRRRQLEHVLGSCLLPGLRARHTAAVDGRTRCLDFADSARSSMPSNTTSES